MNDFYSHAREGRDITNLSYHHNSNDFYSHAREGRDTFEQDNGSELVNFYSHAREGRDNMSAAQEVEYWKFLLTRPRGT